MAAVAHAQTDREHGWTLSGSLGGYVEGNQHAVASWLRSNGYGFSGPPQCAFDIALEAQCDPPPNYPRTNGSGAIGWTFGIRHSLGPRFAFELGGASEQSGAVLGRCDDLRSPRDVRCTDRFITVDIGGASLGGLAILNRGAFHYGLGPALLMANWQMQPSHLPGVWFDLRFGGDSFPLFAHAQYRFYKSASFAPAAQFTTFHPATLFLGGGLVIGFEQERDR